MLPSELLQRLDEEAGRATEPVVAYVHDGRLLDALSQHVHQLVGAMRERHYDPARSVDRAAYHTAHRDTVWYPRALQLSLQTLLAHLTACSGLSGFLMSTELPGRPVPSAIDVSVRRDAREDTAESVRLHIEYALSFGEEAR